MRTERQVTGDRAEELAAEFLKAQGWRIMDRNFRARTGELDLVARDGETVVFVEVRCRSRAGFVSPEASVAPGKRLRVIRAARYYAWLKRLDCPMRFDVVAVEEGRLRHLRAAFDSSAR